MITSRRGLITGLASLLAAPAIVRVGSIMPVKAFVSDAERWTASWWTKVPGSGEWKYIQSTGTYAHCMDIFKTRPISGVEGQWVFGAQVEGGDYAG